MALFDIVFDDRGDDPYDDWGDRLRRVGPGLRRVADVRGRSSRPDFWWYTLDIAAFAITAQALLCFSFVVTRQELPWSRVVGSWWDSILWCTIAFEVLIAAAVVRRLHDTGRSGRSAIVPLAAALGATWSYGRAWKFTAVARENAGIDVIESVGSEGDPSLVAVVDSVRDASDVRAEFGHLALAGLLTVVAFVTVGLLIYRLARVGMPGPNDHGAPPTDVRDDGALRAVASPLGARNVRGPAQTSDQRVGCRLLIPRQNLRACQLGTGSIAPERRRSRKRRRRKGAIRG